jgi:plastocyanin
VLVAVVGGVGARPAGAATHTVTLLDSAFTPPAITVAVGDTVVWENADAAQHTVTADDGAFDSGTLDPGETFRVTFSSAGPVGYACVFHSAGGVGMVGRVVVTAPPRPTTTTTWAAASPPPSTSVGAPDAPEAAAPSPSPPPSGLPATGADVPGVVLVGAGALAAGALALAAALSPGTRRRGRS